MSIWERVYTINDYYDGPRRGVADFLGTPHIYQSHFWEDTPLGDPDTYSLSEISPDLLAQILEDWAIWLRWDEAFKRGTVDQSTHPALPEDRERHDVLSALIGDRLKVDPATAIIKRARFRGRGWNGLEVQWLEPPESDAQPVAIGS